MQGLAKFQACGRVGRQRGCGLQGAPLLPQGNPSPAGAPGPRPLYSAPTPSSLAIVSVVPISPLQAGRQPRGSKRSVAGRPRGHPPRPAPSSPSRRAHLYLGLAEAACSCSLTFAVSRGMDTICRAGSTCERGAGCVRPAPGPRSAIWRQPLTSAVDAAIAEAAKVCAKGRAGPLLATMPGDWGPGRRLGGEPCSVYLKVCL